MISTKGLTKPQVLVALYNASRPFGMGFVHATPGPLSELEAQLVLKHQTYFDYLKGRLLKVDLSKKDYFDEYLYDRDLGPGAAQRAIDAARKAVTPQNG